MAIVRPGSDPPVRAVDADAVSGAREQRGLAADVHRLRDVSRRRRAIGHLVVVVPPEAFDRPLHVPSRQSHAGEVEAHARLDHGASHVDDDGTVAIRAGAVAELAVIVVPPALELPRGALGADLLRAHVIATWSVLEAVLPETVR